MDRKDYTGQTLDNRYKIQKRLGLGGMGAVYLGQHVIIDKSVAVKFLHAEFVENEEMVRRFYREAQAAAAVHHKNIIDVLDVGVSSEGEPFLVMEYLEGESLSVMLKRTGPISLPAACGILEPVLSALAAAHDKSIVHRDLKPENIFIADGDEDVPNVKLIDFGISKILSSKQKEMTRTGAILGTPAYMSPEQILFSKEVDARTDIYAIGVVLYEMLTGKVPFKGAHYEAMIYSVMSDEPIPPREAYADFPMEAEPLVMRILSKDPDERPQSAAALLEEIKTLTDYPSRHQHLSKYTSGITNKSFAGGALGPPIPEGSGGVAEAVFSGLTPKTTPTEWSTNRQRSKRNRTRGVAIGASGLLAIGVAIAVVLWRGDDPKATPERRDAPVADSTDSPKASPPSTGEKTASLQVSSDVKVQTGSATETQAQYIQIAVRGAPENAVFFYGDTRYDKGPIKVRTSKASAALRVTAAGYKDEVFDITPDRDYAIIARLEPVPQAAKNMPASSRTEKTETPVKETTPTKKSDQKTKKPKTRSTAKPPPVKGASSTSTGRKETKPTVSDDFTTNW